MTENEKKALDIVMELKTAKQETRDEWRRIMLEQYPQDVDFIEQAYKMASV